MLVRLRQKYLRTGYQASPMEVVAITSSPAQMAFIMFLFLPLIPQMTQRLLLQNGRRLNSSGFGTPINPILLKISFKEATGICITLLAPNLATIL